MSAHLAASSCASSSQMRSSFSLLAWLWASTAASSSTDADSISCGRDGGRPAQQACHSASLLALLPGNRLLMKVPAESRDQQQPEGRPCAAVLRRANSPSGGPGPGGSASPPVLPPPVLPAALAAAWQSPWVTGMASKGRSDNMARSRADKRRGRQQKAQGALAGRGGWRPPCAGILIAAIENQAWLARQGRAQAPLQVPSPRVCPCQCALCIAPNQPSPVVIEQLQNEQDGCRHCKKLQQHRSQAVP